MQLLGLDLGSTTDNKYSAFLRSLTLQHSSVCYTRQKCSRLRGSSMWSVRSDASLVNISLSILCQLYHSYESGLWHTSNFRQAVFSLIANAWSITKPVWLWLVVNHWVVNDIAKNMKVKMALGLANKTIESFHNVGLYSLRLDVLPVASPSCCI